MTYEPKDGSSLVRGLRALRRLQLARRGLTISELAEILQVERRQVYRYLADLEEAGLALHRRPAPGGYQDGRSQPMIFSLEKGTTS